MANDNDSRISTEDRSVPAEPAVGVFTAMRRGVVAVLRLIGLVVAIGGAVALKLALRQNPGVAVAIGIVTLAGLGLIFGASMVAQALAADANRSKPSAFLGAAKLGLGSVLIAGALVPWERFGLFNAVPYGWSAALPYAIAIAVGSLGVLSGGMALVGRRAHLGVRLTIALALLAALAFGLPAISPVRFIGQVSYKSANKMTTSADGNYAVIETSVTSSGLDATVFRTDPLTMVREIPLSGTYTVPIALSPDGALLACMQRGKVQILETESGRQLAETAIAGVDDDVGVTLSFSRDGTRLFMTVSRRALSGKPARREAIVLDRAGVELQRLAVPPEGGELKFTPDGSSVGSVSHSEKQVAIQVWDFAARRVDANCQFSTAREIKYGPRLTWSPDSTRVLVSVNSDLVLFDARGGEPVWRIDFAQGGQDAEVRDVAFRGDAKRVLVALDQDRLLLLDADTGRRLDQLNTIPAYRFAWTAAGTRLFTAPLFGPTEFWDASRFTDR